MIFRQFIKRKPVVTEYLIDGLDGEEGKSQIRSETSKIKQNYNKKLKISSEDSRIDGKNMMSQTKVNELDEQSNLK